MRVRSPWIWIAALWTELRPSPPRMPVDRKKEYHLSLIHIYGYFGKRSGGKAHQQHPDERSHPLFHVFRSPSFVFLSSSFLCSVYSVFAPVLRGYPPAFPFYIWELIDSCLLYTSALAGPDRLFVCHKPFLSPGDARPFLSLARSARDRSWAGPQPHHCTSRSVISSPRAPTMRRSARCSPRTCSAVSPESVTGFWRAFITG